MQSTPPTASAEEILAALDEIEQRLNDGDDDIAGLDEDVAALDAAIRYAAPEWSKEEGLVVLCRVDQVVLQAIQRRADVSAALGQQGSSRRAAARYGAF